MPNHLGPFSASSKICTICWMVADFFIISNAQKSRLILLPRNSSITTNTSNLVKYYSGELPNLAIQLFFNSYMRISGLMGARGPLPRLLVMPWTISGLFERGAIKLLKYVSKTLENWARRLSTILKVFANYGVWVNPDQSGWLITFYRLRTLALKLFSSESAYLKR